MFDWQAERNVAGKMSGNVPGDQVRGIQAGAPAGSGLEIGIDDGIGDEPSDRAEEQKKSQFHRFAEVAIQVAIQPGKEIRLQAEATHSQPFLDLPKNGRNNSTKENSLAEIAAICRRSVKSMALPENDGSLCVT